MIVRTIKPIAFSFVFKVVGLAQGDFNLDDLNTNSETYGDTIGPADYLGDICIVYFGHEY